MDDPPRIPTRLPTRVQRRPVQRGVDLYGQPLRVRITIEVPDESKNEKGPTQPVV